MKLVVSATSLVLLLALSQGGAGLSTGTTFAQQGKGASLDKVIQMLTDMAAKSKLAKNDEQVAYAKFSEYCKTETASLSGSIAKAKEDIELLGASISQLTSDAEVLGEEIAKLDSEIAANEEQKKEQTAQREKDHKDFLAEQLDYAESISALERAIVVLQKQNYDRPASAAALIQLSDNQHLPDRAKSVIAAFVSMLSDDDGDSEPASGDFMDYSAPEANAYEFQSGGIIALLKRLLKEFVDKKGTIEKEEMNSRHAYDMIMLDLTDSIENAEKDIKEKTALKESKLAQAATDKKDLAATATAKKEDEKTLADLQAECEEKKLSFEEKQKLRTEEIEAILKAIEILKDPTVLGNYDKYLSLAQSKGRTSLLQLRETGTAAEASENVRHQVRDFLAGEAQRLHSKSLSLLVSKLAADPFAKVKKLIGDMITRLLEEANADAKKEGYCDTETGKSKITRAKLTSDIDALTAAIESAKATIMTLTEEIKTLTTEVADLRAAMAEATELRTAEKAKNAQTIEDAVEAQKAVSAALAILKDFYAKAATATAFVQKGAGERGFFDADVGVKMGTPEWDSLANPNFDGTVDKGHKEGMQTFGEKYVGQQDEAGGVLALLEVVLSDFAGLESDTKAAETESQKMYEEFMIQSKKSVAVKEKKIEMNTADKASTEAQLQTDIADLKRTQDELLAADRAYAIIEDQCVDKGMTFKERTAAREEEIASLKQALKILSSADIVTSA